MLLRPLPRPVEFSELRLFPRKEVPRPLYVLVERPEPRPLLKLSLRKEVAFLEE